MPNEYYENEMSYLYALSDIMKEKGIVSLKYEIPDIKLKIQTNLNSTIA